MRKGSALGTLVVVGVVAAAAAALVSASYEFSRERIAANDVLDDLRSPPGNRLELLKGDLAGYYSIRINDQWRICFVWSEGGASNVKILDYHR